VARAAPARPDARQVEAVPLEDGRPRAAAAFDALFIAASALLVAAVYLVTGPRDDAGAFAALADGFLHGHLFIDHDMPWLELVPVAPGSHFWYVPLPPVPAILLVPVVGLFGPSFDVGIIAALAGGLNVVLLWLLLAAIGVPSRVQPWLVAAFALGSVEWWAAGMAGTHLDAQVASVTFALLALNLAVRRRWPLLGGLFLGLAAGSRLPVGLTLPLYVALYGGLSVRPPAWPDREGLVRIAWLVLGVAIIAAPIALYNVARFGSPLDFGYTRIPSSYGMVLDEPWYTNGLNCLCYVPRNLHALFIRGFDYVDQPPWFRPNWTSLSILITTPVVLWLVKARSWAPLIVFGWIAVVLGILPDITHGGVGWTQYGYRRILDVAPVLFLMLGWVFRNGMSVEAKAAIVAGIGVMAYGIYVINVLNFVSF